MKRRIITLLGALLMLVFIGEISAQVPQAMNYQAVARDVSGNLIANHAIGIQLIIHQDSSTGTTVYSETFATSTNQFGLFTIAIGQGTPVTGTFNTIVWSSGNYWLQVQMDPTGGTTYADMGTSQLLTVPYAFYAETVGSTSGHYVGELYGGGIVVAVWKEAGIEKGLIASLVDVSASAIWSSITGTLIGATAQSPRDGQANTTAIVLQGDVSGAAYICDNYSSGGFSDWYLPAAWELNQCYNAAIIVNEVLGDTDGFQFARYWSSTEYDSNNACLHYFANETITGGYSKSATYRVRAVRRF